MCVILVNTLSLILWTVPTLKVFYALWFHLVEYCTVSVSVVQCGLRFWAAPRPTPEGKRWPQRFRFVISPTGLIDAVVILPSFVAIAALVIFGDSFGLSSLLAIRLLTRSAKLARYFPGGRRLGLALRLKAGQLLTAVAGLLVVLVIAAALLRDRQPSRRFSTAFVSRQPDLPNCRRLVLPVHLVWWLSARQADITWVVATRRGAWPPRYAPG